MEIATHFFLTGEMGGSNIKEKSLFFDRVQDLVVATGCSHPGIVVGEIFGRKTSLIEWCKDDTELRPRFPIFSVSRWEHAMNLENLGYDDWFEGHVKANDDSRGTAPARVVAVDKGSYVIANSKHEMRAEITGKLMYAANSPLDYPTVGDWVLAQPFDDNTFAVIHDILPRKTVLKRKMAGKKVDFQLIAANIDTSFIVQSLDQNYNIKRLERYLVMIKTEKIQPIVILSKSDLVNRSEIEEKTDYISKLYSELIVIPLSHIDSSGLDELKSILKPHKTYCLIGSSGVGKTTLINHLLGDRIFDTQEVRKNDGKGRHTTTRRQLTRLENGAMIVDTPGMRELGNISIDEGLKDVFEEVEKLAEKCRYNDCKHINERGCAIISALADGQISEERYNNYIKILKETRFLEMTYLEKKNRERAFGKMVKSAKRDIKKRKG